MSAENRPGLFETSFAAHPDLQRIILFSGHFCAGHVIGYRVATEFLERFQLTHATENEIVAIVENHSCVVDALQVVAGCTFGKGNLIFLDYGKHIYTLVESASGRALRFLPKFNIKNAPGPTPGNPVRMAWTAACPFDELFEVEELNVTIPPPLPKPIWNLCPRCGEWVTDHSHVPVDGQALCYPCAAKAGAVPARSLPPWKMF
jgi:formylmethanofuran dehydrogenase subunit E